MTKKVEETAVEEVKTDLPLNVAKETLLGDIRDVALQIIKDPKLTGKCWKDMNEEEQRLVVCKITDRARDAIINAVDLIASDGNKAIKAVLTQVTVKDGFKGVFQFGESEKLRHELVDAQGKNILITLIDAHDFVGEGEEVEIDPDQRELSINEGPDND